MKKFLIAELGPEKGAELYQKTQERYQQLLKSATEKPGQQKKIFEKMLLPRIALYKTLQENGYTQQEAYDLLEKHMIEIGAKPQRKNYGFMDKFPFAYQLFRFGFTHVVPSSNLWEADIDKSKKDEFKVTMHKSFWHDTYVEYGCPEVCAQACKCDDLTYGGLRHIEYLRTQTLGTGGSCCDFHFKKK